MYEHTTAKRARQYLKQYRKQLAHKEKVAARHNPGTSAHTRATREAQTYREHIDLLEKRLKELEGGPDA